jgi:DNA-binding NtrC family response regulator
MKILILCDDVNRSVSFEKELELRDQSPIIAHTAEACLKLYYNESQVIFFNTDPVDHIQPFDAVVLHCDSCEVNVIEICKQILAVNPRQRIVLTLEDGFYERATNEFAEEANYSLDIVQKPIAIHSLIDIIELKDVYSELQKMQLDTDAIRRANFRHEQIVNLINIVNGSRAAHLNRLS